jgi:hypothetical protein
MMVMPAPATMSGMPHVVVWAFRWIVWEIQVVLLYQVRLAMTAIPPPAMINGPAPAVARVRLSIAKV